MTIIAPAYIGAPAVHDLDIVAIPVADLLRRFSNMMNDTDQVRWEEAEAIDWFNDAAREIVLRRPAARAVTSLLTLKEGTFQQTAPGNALLLDVVRNVNPDGSPGRAIRITDRQQLDDAEPDWHTMAPRKTLHFMMDERSPTTFYVYPPAELGAKVEVLVALPPPAVTSVSESIDMRVEFINAILNWAMYRAHTKDSEYAQGAVASLHYQAFTDAIGAPAQAAQVNSASANTV